RKQLRTQSIVFPKKKLFQPPASSSSVAPQSRTVGRVREQSSRHRFSPIVLIDRGQRKLIMEQTQENVKRRSWSKRHKRALPIQFEATPMLLNQHEDVATRKTKERSEITKRKPKARRLISESAGSWDSLTYDIQFMILLRLSACYIPRLRLVCKSMRNLLSSDRFIHAHLDYHRFHTMTQIRFLVSTYERVTRHPSIVRTNHHDVAFDLDDNGCATLISEGKERFGISCSCAIQ
ncbi:hypothetical protein AKJ16_DCAP25031, partial [Drosera capensis]